MNEFGKAFAWKRIWVDPQIRLPYRTREHNQMSFTTVPQPTRQAFETNIPERLDRLPWGSWHWRVVIALGITWLIDGLEVTFVGAINGVLHSEETLHLSESDVGFLGSAYLAGAVLGALVFGYLTDRLGRKLLFTVTLAIYLTGTLLSAFSWNLWSFAFFRLVTGAGIGGEYSAINSAIDEMIPARVRGRVDLFINGSYWIGAGAGALATLVLLDRDLLPINLGWRLGFGIGAALGLIIIFYRNHVPESPRWLLTHGRKREAEEIIDEIEGHFVEQQLPEPEGTMTIHPHGAVGFRKIADTMLRKYLSRTIFGLSLMISQAFLYNAFLFTYSMILIRFYEIPNDRTGLFLIPFAFGNFLGPVLLGPLFDSVGRKPMIAGTYGISAVLLAITGWLFVENQLTATTQTALWTVIFFFASAASSSAYLTVSEIFPLELRGIAIALFYAVGTAIGGIAAPWMFGRLIQSGSRVNVHYGFLFASGLLVVAVVMTLLFGVKAERASLETVAEPLAYESAD
jgi:MFS family permease